MIFRLFTLLLISTSLFSCAQATKKIEDTDKALFESANSLLKARYFEQASTKLEEIRLKFPFSKFAEQALLESIYAYHKQMDYTSAIMSADRFIRQHPQHPSIDYAYYMKGIATFESSRGILDNLTSIQYFKRDLSQAIEAYGYFKQLIIHFPQSEYSRDARQRMIYIRDLLAKKELYLADYYQQREAYIASSNRALNIIKHYQGTSVMADAIALLYDNYRSMGMTDLSDDTYNLLKNNFPEYPNLNKKGKLYRAKVNNNEKFSWWNMLTFGWFRKG